ncbi:uncharacterized protein LOC141914134 [Tubulanus polymorphus]|uniref:uncharacterized protein LOC141914134 n=1 Tax=Tubulanus polymorphus TaxID=672921 RepID=UPI003DA4897E
MKNDSDFRQIRVFWSQNDEVTDSDAFVPGVDAAGNSRLSNNNNNVGGGASGRPRMKVVEEVKVKSPGRMQPIVVNLRSPIDDAERSMKRAASPAAPPVGRGNSRNSSNRKASSGKENHGIHNVRDSAAKIPSKQTITPPSDDKTKRRHARKASLKDLCKDDKRKVATLIHELAVANEDKNLAELALDEHRKQIENLEMMTQQEKEKSKQLEQHSDEMRKQLVECQDLLLKYHKELVGTTEKLNKTISENSSTSPVETGSNRDGDDRDDKVRTSSVLSPQQSNLNYSKSNRHQQQQPQQSNPSLNSSYNNETPRDLLPQQQQQQLTENVVVAPPIVPYPYQNYTNMIDHEIANGYQPAQHVPVATIRTSSPRRSAEFGVNWYTPVDESDYTPRSAADTVPPGAAYQPAWISGQRHLPYDDPRATYPVYQLPAPSIGRSDNYAAGPYRYAGGYRQQLPWQQEQHQPLFDYDTSITTKFHDHAVALDDDSEGRRPSDGGATYLDRYKQLTPSRRRRLLMEEKENLITEQRRLQDMLSKQEQLMRQKEAELIVRRQRQQQKKDDLNSSIEDEISRRYRDIGTEMTALRGTTPSTDPVVDEERRRRNDDDDDDEEDELMNLARSFNRQRRDLDPREPEREISFSNLSALRIGRSPDQIPEPRLSTTRQGNLPVPINRKRTHKVLNEVTAAAAAAAAPDYGNNSLDVSSYVSLPGSQKQQQLHCGTSRVIGTTPSDSDRPATSRVPETHSDSDRPPSDSQYCSITDQMDEDEQRLIEDIFFVFK